MRRYLLLAACAPLALAHPAMSQGLPVYDNANVIQRGLQHGETLRQWASQVREMERHYRQLQATYQSVAHVNSVGGLAHVLGVPGVRSPMPSATSLGGIASGLDRAADAGRFVRRNTHFDPTGNDWAAREMRRRSVAVANIQSVIERNVVAAEQRLRGITELQTEIDGQPDIQASAALGNRIQAERLALQNHQSAQQDLLALQAAQQRVDEQRLVEKGREDAEEHVRSTDWAWGALR